MLLKLKQAINDSNNIVFFTGAGLSTASGISDFRSSIGLYKNNYRAEETLSNSFYKNNPKDFYEFYKDKMIYPDAKPNYAHIYMANLQNNKNVSIVTQNIDGLHQKAGSNKVYELHGSIERNYCTNCHKYFNLDYIINSDDIPLCDECESIIKPDVVLYEEDLDDKIVYNAIKAISEADLLIICGTSLVVYPAASFVNYFNGKYLAIINKEETSKDKYCDIVIHADIVETFKKIS